MTWKAEDESDILGFGISWGWWRSGSSLPLRHISWTQYFEQKQRKHSLTKIGSKQYLLVGFGHDVAWRLNSYPNQINEKLSCKALVEYTRCTVFLHQHMKVWKPKKKQEYKLNIS